MSPKIMQTVCLLVIISVFGCESLRILVSFPMPSKSHSILGHGVVRHLLEAGHEVVHITSYPRNETHVKLTEVDVGNIERDLRSQQADQYEAFKLKNLVGKGNFGDSVFVLYFSLDLHRRVLELDNVASLLGNPNEKFDAVIIEWFFHDAIAGLAPVLQCPLIWLGSTEAHWQVLKLVDDIPNPSFNVGILSSQSPPLNFFDRALELWSLIKTYATISYLITPLERSLYNDVFTKFAEKRGVSIPTYDEAIYNGSFLLLNSHPSYGIPFRLPQNSKYIGGYHVDAKVKPLPKNLQEIMDDAKDGVIYFSMGSNLKSADMSDDMKASLLKMFSNFKQTVIWKFESDLENVPSNVHLIKWAPQQSIFSHPNLKLFVTHGGQLSTTEAIHFGVPLIGIPVLGDQYVNMRSVANKGFGVTVTLAEDLAVRLAPAIAEVLENPKYKIKAKEISKKYHQRTVPPGKELVHWVEYVVNTGGALHLRSHALMLPWYQKMYLDLALALFSVSVLILFTLKRALNKILGKTQKTITKRKTK